VEFFLSFFQTRLSTGVQIVSQRLKEEEASVTCSELENPSFESSTDNLVDGLEEEDIQKKELPEVPLEESGLGESRLLDEGDSEMLLTTIANTTTSSSLGETELNESAQISPATFLAESGKEVRPAATLSTPEETDG